MSVAGKKSETLRLTRDCAAVEIPAGSATLLKAPQTVFMMQSLGDTYTLQTEDGRLVRIEGSDADAIGLTPTKRDDSVRADRTINEVVWDVLKSVYDPEIPVNIVELGLIYLCEVDELFAGGYRIDVRMTLTAPGCGMGPVLKNDVETKLKAVPGVKEVEVELVLDPPWDQTMMSEAARLQLGFM